MKLARKYPQLLWRAFERSDQPVAVDITEVIENIGTDLDKWYPPPPGRMPWPNVWMEFTLPDGMRERHGISVRVRDFKGALRAQLIADGDIRENQGYSVDQIRRIWAVEAFVSVQGGRPLVIGQLTMLLDDNDICLASAMHLDRAFWHQEDISIAKPMFTAISGYLRMAVVFLNCKNVTTETIGPRKPKSRRRAKHGGQGDIIYKNLVVLGLGKNPQPVPACQGEGDRRRLHICRGHLADHRKAGLFGDPTRKGVYWVPMHMKGHKQKGEVIKSYTLAGAAPSAPLLKVPAD